MVNFRNLLLVLIAGVSLFSCNEEDKKCSDDFVVAYQRMGDSFEAVYRPRSGSFELNNLAEAIDLFLADNKDVSCTYKGSKLNPTVEAQGMRQVLPKLRQKSLENFLKVFPKVIYGDDNREQVADSPGIYQSWASATMAQISPDEWDADFNFISKSYGDEFSLCSGERFFDELSVSRCSGFLVAPDIVVTAGHCVQNENDCQNFKWVLDFKDGVTSTNPNNIFSCKSIISRDLNDDSLLDYAVLRLDRSVKGRKFFRTRTAGTVSNGTELVLIGHPSGLSTKVAAGAIVRSSSSDIYFKTNTDSFGGNSGSAVINAQTGVVEGVLVRGDSDYDVVDASDGSRCRVERVCANDGCQGEDVTKMTSVKGIPLVADPVVIRKGFYQDKNFPSAKEGLPIEFLSYSYGGYTLGGLKFLDRCGVHFYNDGSPELWENFYAGECGQQQDIDQVINTFGNLFYL